MQRDVFTAIADPTRRQLLTLLSQDAMNINEVASHFSMTRTAVSKHMRILDECGLLKIEKMGRERYCRASLEKLAEVAVWVNQYRMFWNDNLDRLEALLKAENDQKKNN